SFWTGYGFRAGMTLNTVFMGNYYEMKYLQTSTITGSPNGGVYTSSSGTAVDTQSEIIKTKSVFAGGIYFPIGVQIRFSRKNNLWNKLAFTAEVKSSLDFQGVPGNGILTRFYMNQSFGLKYYFENNSTK